MYAKWQTFCFGPKRIYNFVKKRVGCGWGACSMNMWVGYWTGRHSMHINTLRPKDALRCQNIFGTIVWGLLAIQCQVIIWTKCYLIIPTPLPNTLHVIINAMQMNQAEKLFEMYGTPNRTLMPVFWYQKMIFWYQKFDFLISEIIFWYQKIGISDIKKYFLISENRISDIRNTWISDIKKSYIFLIFWYQKINI